MSLERSYDFTSLQDAHGHSIQRELLYHMRSKPTDAIHRARQTGQAPKKENAPAHLRSLVK